MAKNALAPSPALLAALHETLLSGERQSSAVRPEIAGYLLDHGLAPLHAALSAAGESPDALCAEVWRLMLATVSARRFGVSTDAWRENDDYPDRYFPLLWLTLVPAALPASSVAMRVRYACTAAAPSGSAGSPPAAAKPSSAATSDTRCAANMPRRTLLPSRMHARPWSSLSKTRSSPRPAYAGARRKKWAAQSARDSRKDLAAHEHAGR